MTAAQTTTPRPNNNGWSPERRARQSAAIRRWAPWKKSTGPKTAAGKARVARNAVKNWPEPMRTVKTCLALHNLYLAEYKEFSRMAREKGKNKLLDRRLKYREKALVKLGYAINGRIIELLESGICKNLAFPPPLPIKVNAK